MKNDIALARRLEQSTAVANRHFILGRQQIHPHRRAAHLEAGGASAFFDGPASPITQSFSMGLAQEFNEHAMTAIEDFFFSRGAPATHEVCPLASKPLWSWLRTRGYEAIEFSNVLYLPLADWNADLVPFPSGIDIHRVGPAEAATWARTAMLGWSELTGLEEEIGSLIEVQIARRDGILLLAEKAGTPIATAALLIHDGVAEMAGASTIPSHRQQGAQTALILSRLHEAKASGCDLAAIAAEPGSASQQNAERFGFRVAYTRTKWFRPCP